MLLSRAATRWVVASAQPATQLVRVFTTGNSNNGGNFFKRNKNVLLAVWTGLCGAAGASYAIHLQRSETPSTELPKISKIIATPTKPSFPDFNTVYDAAIIGGGVVGLAIARELAVSFPEKKFILLEKGDDLVSGASSGNSGLGCTGYDAPSGSLERQLLRRSTQRHPNLYRSLGLSYEHTRKCGALVVAWDDEQLAKLPSVLQDNLDAGDSECRILSAKELLDLEPCLGIGQRPLGAVLVPREVVAEPWLVPIAYAESARRNGCTIKVGADVTALWVVPSAREFEPKSNKTVEKGGHAVPNDRDWYWIIVTGSAGESVDKTNAFAADVVINCAGLFGDEMEILRKNAAVQAAQTETVSVERAIEIAAAGETPFTSSGNGGSSSATGGGGHEHRSFSIRPRKVRHVFGCPPPFIVAKFLRTIELLLII